MVVRRLPIRSFGVDVAAMADLEDPDLIFPKGENHPPVAHP
jgi:hypothetical protein